MKIIEGIQQGSAAWHAHRATARNASEAAAMMGLSPYMSRNELIRQKATGLTPEVDPNTQRRFDRGHEIEAFARGLAEQYIGEALYPVIATDDDGYLSASFDGLSMAEDTAWECKTANADLHAALDAGDLPDGYWPQVEQQLLISGATRAIFTISDGTEAGTRHMEYLPRKDRQERLMAAWRQFDADVAAYVYQEVIPAPVAAPQAQLPAVSIQIMGGAIEVRDNLKVFGDQLRAYIDQLNLKPETDQDFANLEAAVKKLGEAEKALDAAESGALAQAESIALMQRLVAEYRELSSTTRLAAEKIVKAEKENRKLKIVSTGIERLRQHILALNERIGLHYMPQIAADFQGAIKGKKLLSAMEDAVDTELARCKIEANAIADQIELNLRAFRGIAGELEILFPDLGTLVLKAADDFKAVVEQRVANHKREEDARLERERVRIRAEEEARAQAKAAAEAAAKIEADRTATPPAILPAAPSTATEGAGPAVAAAQVERQASVADTDRKMNLSEICARLDFTVTAHLLDRLGFPAKLDRNAKLYREADFPLICQALINHIAAVANQKLAA